ncbi:RidA family protein [candidate division KSB1 bacterium]
MQKYFKIFTILMTVVLIMFFACSGVQETQSLEKKIISGDTVSNAPYSPGVVVGNTLYCSGSIGTNPETNELGEGIKEQTKLVLDRMKSIVEKAGFSMGDVVKVTVFLQSIDDYTGMNEVYATYFPEDPPARETVAVKEIVKGALVEISCIAVK